MIEFENVSKSYHIRKFQKHVFADLNFTIAKGESLGICGANGAGKSTLMRLIAGIEQPSSGRVTRDIRTSWPIGYSSCFQSSLTGADNARFIARIYNQDEQTVIDYVEDFAQLGPYLYHPVGTYSAGMGSRLAFASRLRSISNAILSTRSPAPVMSASARAARRNCSSGATMQA